MIVILSKQCIAGRSFISASNEPGAVPARAFGECHGGQIPRSLLRCKSDAPLLAAGYLAY